MPVTSKVMERKPLTLTEKMYLPQVVSGLGITLKNFFRKKVTMEYPEVKPPIPEYYRGQPALVKDPNGREKCVSCQLCEFVCPPKAIKIIPGSISEDSDNIHVEKAPQEFEIDMLRCIYCGMCEEVCPEEAIFMQDVYSLNGLSRDELKFKKQKLYEIGGVREDSHFKWDKKKQAELKGGAHT
ncbi:MAG: NADH-quinone oxidoreductase subunit I [Puniceicoccaceae bacterium]